MMFSLDCEFLEDGRTIELISLALVGEDGRELYVQNRNANVPQANPWVQAHVIPHLDHATCRPRQRGADIGRTRAKCATRDCPWRWRDEIGACVLGFLAETSPTFLTYCGAYDWVALCQLYGPMINLPQGWPRYAKDLRQMLDEWDATRGITQPEDMPHHALRDARWIMQTYKESILWEAESWTPPPL